MSNIVELSASGELCQAAYSPLVKGVITVAQLAFKANGERNMSSAQAQDFASRYTVAEVFSDSLTGAFAVVFEDKNSHVRTLAIRGTLEVVGDIAPTDHNIALWGAGYDQIAALYSWWARVSSRADRRAMALGCAPVAACNDDSFHMERCA